MDKDLIQKLNSLKEIKPNASWKENNRRVLLAQITTGSEKQVHSGFFSVIHQPAWAVFGILLLVLAGGGLSAHATKNIKPGNSLFIARVVSEKAQLAMTFNKEKKVKLDMKLAKNRAKEITEVMSDPKFDYQDEAKVQKLASNFRNDIKTVKARLQEINKTKENIKEEEKLIRLGTISREEGKVFTVESSRDNIGIAYEESKFRPEGTKEDIPIAQITKTTEEIVKIETSTPEKIPTITTEATTTEENINNIMDKMEETFKAKDFEGTRDMLKEVDDIINNIEEDTVLNKGEVKGVEEQNIIIEEIPTSTN